MSGMATLAFNPSTGRQRQTDLCEFEASSLVYRVPGQPGTHRETLSQINKARYNKGTVQVAPQKASSIAHLPPEAIQLHPPVLTYHPLAEQE